MRVSVYVLNMRGEPLMPTSPSKARKLLKTGKAKVKRTQPFTIQLTIATGETKQAITLGVDAGSKTVGLSATTDEEEVYAAECLLRADVVDNLATRREFRRSRRHRKTRYRKARFNNRLKSKAWLAPSVEQKIETHFRLIRDVHKILPITKIRVEVAQFDIQKIKNPDISGIKYQQGEQLDFWNVREYVLWRDGHKCVQCSGKSGDSILNVHHIESRKVGGNAPNNLVTLCETCHNKHHMGEIQVKMKRSQSFRDVAFMGIMRWAFYNSLKELYPNVSLTYGYITKNTRIQNGLGKSHIVDARCVTGNPLVVPSSIIYELKAVRTKNRQIHKATTNKGNYRKLNQQPKYVHGFQLYDKVQINNGVVGFIGARRKSGSFRVVDARGNQLANSGISYKKLRLLENRKAILTGVKTVIS